MLHGLHDYASVIFDLHDLFCRRMFAFEMKGRGTSQKARVSTGKDSLQGLSSRYAQHILCIGKIQAKNQTHETEAGRMQK